MVVKKWSIVLFSSLLLIAACTSINHISKTDVKYTVVKSDAVSEDAEVNAIIAPYKAQLDAVMNEVLIALPVELTKQKPESTLGNWVTDVITERMRKEGYEVDLAIVNYGGLRVPYISPGPVTRGEIFELAPFDNLLMIVDVPGHKLDSAFLMIAESDGWPVSSEVRMVVKDKKVSSMTISGQPIDRDRIYKLVTLDYVANGGDNMKMLIPLDRKQTSFVFRDVLIDYLKDLNSSGKEFKPSLDGRISRL